MVLKPRLDKLKAIIEDKKLDAAVITRPDNIQYYLGVRTIVDSILILYVTRDGYAELYTPALEYYRMKASVPNNVEVTAFTTKLELEDAQVVRKKPGDILKDIYKKHKKIGYDPEGSPLTTTLQKIFKKKAEDLTRDISRQRMIKEPGEINSIALAVEATIRGIKTAIASLYEDITEKTLAGVFEQRVRIEGSEEQAFPPLTLFKPGNSYPHNLPGDNRLGRRNLVLIDVGIKINGYSSDLTRTIPWGRVSRDEKRIIEAVNEAVEEAIDTGGPGVKAEELDMAARRILRKYGYDKYFIHGLGHGLGINVHEPPAIAPGSSIVLEPGMVFTIEPGVYIPGKLGVRIEEDVVVTEKGLKVLSRRLSRILYP